MSASTEKKLRKAAREAGTDKKLIAAQEEAAKKAASKRKWTLGTIAVVLVCAIIIFLGSGVLYKSNAMTIGEEKYSAAEVNYFVGNQFQNFYNQYGDYASMFGLDLSLGISGLSEQECMMNDGGTWKDYFLELAEQQMTEVQALCKYAEENGISLTEEEIAASDDAVKQNESYVTLMGYGSVESFYALNYGSGVDSKLVMEQNRRIALANKAATAYADSLVYSDAELEEKYQSYNGEQDLIDYSYYYVAAETESVTAEDGTVSTQVVEGGFEASKAIANKVLEAYEAAKSEDYLAEFDGALASVIDGASATEQLTNAASMSSIYKDWLLGSREAGDAAVIENNTNGCYVVVFAERSDNHYNVAQVRHILVKALADENGEYSEAAKAEAKKQAEEILNEWKSGEATESSFATLANLKSEDPGSNTNGGLYDAVVKGQMVEEFDAFCFEEGRKSGDTAIVYGETASYAGYHVMYYVGEGELYSNAIAEADLKNTALNEWLTALTENYSISTAFGLKLVG